MEGVIRVVPITVNRDSALRYLRKPKGRLTIWVNAVRTNQNDAKERDAQVVAMSRIYQGVSVVHCRLGVELSPRDGAQCMEILKR